MTRQSFFLLIGCMLLGAAAVSAQPLRAGYAKVDITPAEPVTMGGYDLRDAPSDGVYPGDKLYVRALVFEAGSTRVAFVEADLIGVRNHDAWRAKIASATGIPAANILLGDVHNHASPSPAMKANAHWAGQFESALLACVKQAAGRVQPVRVAAGTGRSRVAMNRREVLAADKDSFITFDENNSSQSFGKYKTNEPVMVHEPAGVVRLGLNPAGPIDEDVQLVRLDTAEGKPLAVMIHYACHGTSLGGRNSKISGEWMGRMQAYIEQQVGASAIYLQGAAGDVNPRVVGGLNGAKDDVHTTWALGEEIGREAVRVYRGLSPVAVDNPRMQIASQDILLPRTYRELFQDFRNTVVHAPTTAVRIGDLMWVTFPGEMFNTIGKRVKADCPVSYAHLMGYTNGSIGYFPEQKAFAEGGYEPTVSHLAPSAEKAYLRQIVTLLNQFR